MPVQVLENFLPNGLADTIEQTIGDNHLAWYWRESSTYYDERSKTSKDFQFVHVIFYEGKVTSDTFGLARELLIAFEKHTGKVIKDVFRIKANLTVPSILNEAELDDAIHIDTDAVDKNLWSIVYYVSDSDGDTLLYDNAGNVVDKKSPVKGTAICFPSLQKHRHTPPTHHKRRLVINFVVEIA